MTKKRAIEILHELMGCFKSEYEGTEIYKECKDEFNQAIKYIENKL